MIDRRLHDPIIDLLIVGAVFLVTSFFITISTNSLSATFDEPFYLDAGLTSWRTGSNKMLMKAGTMPLPVDLATGPLYLLERERDRPYVVDTDCREMLLVARKVNLVFWLALLGYSWRLGTLLGGRGAGLTVLGLVATEPNLMAHAGLATTDLAITAAVVAATVHFLLGRGQTWRWRVLVPGIAYGVALLCKASALAFVPLIWGVIAMRELVADGLWNPLRPESRVAIRQLVRDFCGQFLVAMVVTFVYCGSDWKTERTFVEWAHKLPDGHLKAAMIPISENLKIFTNAGEALAQQIKHNFRGHGSYVLGQWHDHSVWYYFPIALSAKLTIPALLLLAGSILFRSRFFFGPAGLIALALLLFSVNCRVQIGLRLVFPLVAFLLIASAVALRPPPSASRAFRRVTGIAWGLIIVWQLVISLLQGGDRLRYVNPLWGGVERGHEVLNDSNTDWGQGVHQLADWYRGQNDSSPKLPMAVWYYGTDPAVNCPPLRLCKLHSAPANASISDFVAMIDSDYLAVSPTLLYGCPTITPSGATAIEWLRREEPIARAGPFFVFRIR